MVVEWPDGLLPAGSNWELIVEAVRREKPDLLVTNEMPFGNWAPALQTFDHAVARDWIGLHEQGLEALARLEAGAIISTRPMAFSSRLANEAFCLEGTTYRALHRKHLFPQEEGWHEANWFAAQAPTFPLHDIAGLRVGVLICTELMFNEHARGLGRRGADLIAVPRATGQRIDSWATAARMAALAGGCYVATSNRSGRASDGGPAFGGGSFLVEPGGFMMQGTTSLQPALVQEVDPGQALAAKKQYPCYVPEDLGLLL